MSTAPISSSSTTTSTGQTGSTGQTSSTGGLGKQDFLSLLVAQLQNQDPMKPMEDREFVAQLAQFNTLESMRNMEEDIARASSASLFTQATSVIGKHIQAKLATDGSTVSGVVTEVRMVQGTPRVIVDGKQIDLTEITNVTSA